VLGKITIIKETTMYQYPVRIATRSNVIFLVMVVVAVLVGLHMRTGSAAPADYCSGTTHVTITADDARMSLNDPMCSTP
jgi:hypothetical protein